jgi:hypothetical protein
MFWKDSFHWIKYCSNSRFKLQYKIVNRLFKSINRHIEENIHFNHKSIEKQEMSIKLEYRYFTPRMGPMFAKE